MAAYPPKDEIFLSFVLAGYSQYGIESFVILTVPWRDWAIGPLEAPLITCARILRLVREHYYLSI